MNVIDIILTNWELIDPKYFYLKGALWGFVAASFFWNYFVPWVKKKLKERHKKKHPINFD